MIVLTGTGHDIVYMKWDSLQEFAAGDIDGAVAIVCPIKTRLHLLGKVARRAIVLTFTIFKKQHCANF